MVSLVVFSASLSINVCFNKQQVVYSLSFAGNSLERDLDSDNNLPLIDERMRRQLQKSHNALLYPSLKILSRLPPQLSLDGLVSDSSLDRLIERRLPPLQAKLDTELNSEYAQTLPRSVNDISSPKLDDDKRAIVVTETKSPFRILLVNSAWEDLCGYNRKECKGRSVGEILQGPETDMSPVTSMIGKLLQGEEVETLLTNYTKDGRKFCNKVTIGPVKDEMGKTVSFVGVLREVNFDERSFQSNPSNERRVSLPFATWEGGRYIGFEDEEYVVLLSSDYACIITSDK